MGPNEKNISTIENEELQIIEALYEVEDFSNSFFDDDSFFFEAED